MSLGNLAPAFSKNDGQMSMKEVARRMTAYLHRKGLARETWTCASRRELRAKRAEVRGRRSEVSSESPKSEVRSPKRKKCRAARPCRLRRAEDGGTTGQRD